MKPTVSLSRTCQYSEMAWRDWPEGWVESGKHLRVRQDFGRGEPVEQSRLSGIRITGEGNGRDRH